MFDTILENGRRGNEQALMRLYDLCCNAVYNAAYNIVLNAEDAEEITHDAILAAFSVLGTFQGTEKAFVAWVKKIATNKSIDKYRRESKNPVMVEINENVDVDENLYPNPNPAPNLNEDENYSIDKIKNALAALPEGYRIVITLRLLEEMEYEDIAKVLNISESGVRSQYSRGIEKLKEKMRDRRLEMRD